MALYNKISILTRKQEGSEGKRERNERKMRELNNIIILYFFEDHQLHLQVFKVSLVNRFLFFQAMFQCGDEYCDPLLRILDR